MLEGVNNKYIYKEKNKMVKMGNAFSKNKFNTKNNKIINKNCLTNTEQNDISEDKNNNINTTLLSTYSADDDYLDIDKIILEKGAELRNDFHI